MEPSERDLDAALYLTITCILRCITCYVSVGDSIEERAFS